MEGKKTVVKTTKIYGMIVAILIAAISIGFASCSKDKKEPVLGPEWYLGGKYLKLGSYGSFDREHFFQFKATDKTYSYVNKNETINGMFKITSEEKTTYNYTLYGFPPPTTEIIRTEEVTLYKMLASGSNLYDKIWVYYCPKLLYTPINNSDAISVHLYQGDKLVQIIENFLRE